MVQKKEMTADFEQLTYTGEMLKDSWEKQLVIFKKLEKTRIAEYGISNFIDWILLNKYYSEWLFVSSSMWRLLISMPKPDGKLNYQQTLEIQVDPKTSLFTMEYSDWDSINTKSDYEKAITWKTKCTNIELVTKFVEFINWNKDWC